MFGSAFLEVIIGLTFVYILLSIVCSALNELIAQVFKMRGKVLKDGIKRLLTDDEIRNKFYRHPLIKSLGKEPKNGDVVRPSYIPSHTFALALFDTIAPAGQKVKQGPEPKDPNNKIPVYAAIRNFSELRETVARLPEGEMRMALLSLIEASNNNLEQVRKNVEAWFDSAMERVSGWYKRQIQWIMLGLAFMVTGIMNADTITLTSSLWQEPALRQEVVAAADRYIAVTENVKENENPNDAKKSQEVLQQKLKDLKQLKLPLGWSKESSPHSFTEWVAKIVGLIFTAFAVSLGAPFWFDLLNKFARLRGSGNVPKKSTETS
jgi:hypothetical protein